MDLGNDRRASNPTAYGEFETILCAERFLVEGLTEMGYEVEVHADGSCLRGYHGEERPERAHVIIRRAQLDGASNDIGFARAKDGRFRAIVSEYDQSIGYNRHWLDKVRERYQAAAKGWLVFNPYTMVRRAIKVLVLIQRGR